MTVKEFHEWCKKRKCEGAELMFKPDHFRECPVTEMNIDYGTREEPHKPRRIIVIIDLSAEPNLQPTCNQLATDLISRQAAIDLWDKYHPEIATKAMEYDEELRALPPAEPQRMRGRWERLMIYLADLQLTYSPNWGANGCGDEKLYEFVTGLIEELEGWEEGGGA